MIPPSSSPTPFDLFWERHLHFHLARPCRFDHGFCALNRPDSTHTPQDLDFSSLFLPKTRRPFQTGRPKVCTTRPVKVRHSKSWKTPGPRGSCGPRPCLGEGTLRSRPVGFRSSDVQVISWRSLVHETGLHRPSLYSGEGGRRENPHDEDLPSLGERAV